MKLIVVCLLLMILSSCFVSKKKYLLLQSELTQTRTDIQDDDKDGVPNYRDLESNTDSLTNVDSKGRTVILENSIDIDQDGILDSVDFCPTIKGISAANGCPDKDGDGVYDFLDKCLHAPGPDSLDGCPVLGKTIVEPRKVTLIKFIDKTTKYKPKTKLILDTIIAQVSDLLLKNSDYKIEIQSHTDSIGDSLKNVDLCQKRAEAIKKLLLKQGVEEQRVFIKALGNSQPKHSNDTKEGREANNRIEFFILNKEEN